MNFADAIRQAAKNAAATPKSDAPEYQVPNFDQPTESPKMQETEAAVQVPQPVTTPVAHVAAFTTNEIEATVDTLAEVPDAPHPSVATGNVIRLELFLGPEQMTQLFRALVATQHAMMTLREAAQYLRVSAATVEQMASDGQLPGMTIEGKWRFPKSSLDEWLNLQLFKKGENHAA